MPKRMLIDATHPEETRVVVLNGTRLEEFDFESSTKRQVKGNIYLAKITRVEPSLQAAFVDYGGSRHGFLAFSEVHPDYYRIPVSDRPHPNADSSDGNGGRSRDNRDTGDNGAADGEDAGVPLASALPEPVRVPLIDDEDDPLGDETNGEPSTEQASEGDFFSRDDADWESSAWDDPFRHGTTTQMPGEDGEGGEAEVSMIPGPNARPDAGAPVAEPSYVEYATPTQTEAAVQANAAVISAPPPDQAEPPVPVAGRRGARLGTGRGPGTGDNRAPRCRGIGCRDGNSGIE